MSNSEFCKVERDGRLTLVTINRPEVLNSLHPPANKELAEVFDAFASDPEQWVAIITGAGDKAFSAGNDLKYQASGQPMSIPPSGFAGLTSRFDLVKPMIAAVNGIAMGGGFESPWPATSSWRARMRSLLCLSRVSASPPLPADFIVYPREIGEKRALGMILTGRRVPAAEGHALGFVNEVVKQGEAVTAAKRWAAQVLECSPMSIRASKEAVTRGLMEASVKAALENQRNYDAVRAMYRSEDFREGPLAFAQKRPPLWKGK